MAGGDQSSVGRRALYVEGERAYDSGVFYGMRSKVWIRWIDSRIPTDAPGSSKLLDDALHDKFLHTNVSKDMSSGTAGGARSA